MDIQNSNADNSNKIFLMQNITKYLPLILIAVFLNLFNTPLLAQGKKSGEIGGSIGGAYYLGDINKMPFVGTRLSASAFYRHTIDTRIAITGNFTYGTLTADDANSSSGYQIDRDESFKNSFYEFSAVGEFNFIPFLPAKRKYVYTPYIFAGVSEIYYPKGENKFILSIPFGVGVKYNINTQYILGAFIGMRKTFDDYVDFYYNHPSPHYPKKQLAYAGNKDWLSIFGVSLSYKIKYRMICPAFD